MSKTSNKKIIEIAILSIEIGNNQIKSLKIYNNSIPSKLAYNFCLEYNLDYESLKRLTYEIKNLIVESNKKMQKNKSYEKRNGNYNENFIQKKINKSVNQSPKKKHESLNEIKKYNFKDITKSIKRPIEFEFKIKIKKDQNYLDEKSRNNNNIIYKNKKNVININNKEINKSSYLCQTASSRSKIKNQKMKLNKSLENEEKKLNENKINNGEKLYDKCMKMKKLSIEKIKNEINLKQKKELSECTFKPKINGINIKCFKNNAIKKSDKKEQVINKVIDNIKIEEDFQIKKEKPKKRPKTAKKEMPIYEKLYNLHFQKKEEEKNNKENLFKPKINNNYKRNLDNKSFKERQIIYSAKSTERKKNLEKQIYKQYDSKTGQKLFHPCINKNRNKCYKNKYYYLSINKGNKKIKNIIQKSSIFKPNIKSDNIFENVIIKSFKKIFYILDSNYKGEISLFNYDTKNLPNSIKKIIKPILNQIDLTNKVFNETKFINKCKKIYKNLDYYSKKEIYKFSEEEDINTELKDLYIFSRVKTSQDSDRDKDINKLNTFYYFPKNDGINNKENENNNSQNKKLYVNNNYYINGKYSKIYERFYDYKTVYKEKPNKFFYNLIIQRDDIIL